MIVRVFSQFIYFPVEAELVLDPEAGVDLAAVVEAVAEAGLEAAVGAGVGPDPGQRRDQGHHLALSLDQGQGQNPDQSHQ